MISKAQLQQAIRATRHEPPGPRESAAGLNVVAVARYLGVADSTVKDAMRRHGLWPVSPLARDAAKLFDEGHTRAEIADRLDISTRHATRMLLEATRQDTPGPPVRVTDDQAAVIRSMRDAGESWNAISLATGLPRSTVRRWG